MYYRDVIIQTWVKVHGDHSLPDSHHMWVQRKNRYLPLPIHMDKHTDRCKRTWESCSPVVGIPECKFRCIDCYRLGKEAPKVAVEQSCFIHSIS